MVQPPTQGLRLLMWDHNLLAWESQGVKSSLMLELQNMAGNGEHTPLTVHSYIPTA